MDIKQVKPSKNDCRSFSGSCDSCGRACHSESSQGSPELPLRTGQSIRSVRHDHCMIPRQILALFRTARDNNSPDGWQCESPNLVQATVHDASHGWGATHEAEPIDIDYDVAEQLWTAEMVADPSAASRCIRNRVRWRNVPRIE
jgi:hypothetical protein